MRRLAVLFLILVAVALVAAVAGILWSTAGHRSHTGSTVLTWHLDRPLVEQATDSVFFGARGSDTLATIYPALRAARADRAVKGLVLTIENADFGLAKTQELRRQLLALRQAGKFVACYMDTAGEGTNGTLAYYLASACESIAISPGGDVNLLGLYADGTFYKNSLDKLRIDPQYHRVGAYKSAGETYTATRWSPASAAAVNAVLDGSYGQIVTAIAAARKLSPATVRQLIDGAPYTAAEAVANRLVDRLAYPDEFRALVATRAGRRIHETSLADYSPSSALAAHHLAVVVAQGTIVRGHAAAAPWSEEVSLGSDDLSRVLRQVGEDDSLAAAILRVDSPGGSALASDLILREVELLAKKKPVIVSMSDVAASGGYYIAARANKIVAEPATLTGSIGVVGGKFVTRRLQEDLLGITHDTLKRGRNADLYSTLSLDSPEQAARIETMMRRVYDTFVGHVAAGRHLSRAAVEQVAAGRVWNGADAKTHGLVDELGGMDRAIELALAAAHLPAGAPVALDYYPEPHGLLDLLRDHREPTLDASLGGLARHLEPTASRWLLELPSDLLRLTRPF